MNLITFNFRFRYQFHSWGKSLETFYLIQFLDWISKILVTRLYNYILNQWNSMYLFHFLVKKECLKFSYWNHGTDLHLGFNNSALNRNLFDIFNDGKLSLSGLDGGKRTVRGHKLHLLDYSIQTVGHLFIICFASCSKQKIRILKYCSLF